METMQSIEIQEMVVMVEKYILEKKGVRVNIVLNNMYNIRRDYAMLQEAYKVAYTYYKTQNKS